MLFNFVLCSAFFFTFCVNTKFNLGILDEFICKYSHSLEKHFKKHAMTIYEHLDLYSSINQN